MHEALTYFRLTVIFGKGRGDRSTLFYKTRDAALAAGKKLREDVTKAKFGEFVFIEDEVGNRVDFRARDFIRTELEPPDVG